MSRRSSVEHGKVGEGSARQEGAMVKLAGEGEERLRK